MFEYIKQAKEIIGFGTLIIGAAIWIYSLKQEVTILHNKLDKEVVNRNEMRCFQYQLEKFNTGLKVPDIDEISGRMK